MYDPCNVYRGRYKEFIENLVPISNSNKGENHHIIPRCCGGLDIEENIILISYSDHYMAHLILAEENPNHKGLCTAIHKMINDGLHPVNSPEDYEIVKILFGKCQSEYMKENSPWRFKTDKQLEVSRRSKSEEIREKISLSVKKSYENPTDAMLESYSNKGFANPKNKHLLSNRRFGLRECLVCGEDYEPTSSTQKFCSVSCKELSYYLRNLPSLYSK